MSDIILAGIGQTPVGEHWDRSLRSLACQALLAAIHDAGDLKPQALFVGNGLAPVLSRQAHVATLVADQSGLRGIEAASVEAGGASGGAALRMGYLAVASGMVDVAAVVGVEKVTDRPSAEVEAALALACDSDYEAINGLTLTAQAALLMRRYLHTYPVERAAFGAFAILAHANGAHNPNAMYRSAISAETYARAGMVSDPVNLFDVAPVADGAAAVILTRRDLMPTDGRPQVKISGSAQASDTLALHDRHDGLEFGAARLSAQRACAQAQIELKDVDLFELHDAYSIYAALALEAIGFAPPGQGWQLAQAGRGDLGGALPLSTFGGCKARGNPYGATGVYQAVEAALQLRGQAGANQVPGARCALIQSLSGPAANAVAHVLQV